MQLDQQQEHNAQKPHDIYKKLLQLDQQYKHNAQKPKNIYKKVDATWLITKTHP